MDLLLVSLASLLAGFVDSIVGGGGLILVPAMFAVFPTTHPATLFGINKGAAVLGTAAATVQYARRVDMPWRSLLPAAAAAFIGAMAGAWTVTVISPDFLRRALPFVLGAVLVYTLMRKDLGHAHDPAFAGRRLTAAACLMGAVIGFYDGFFGPGTGSFFVFLFVRWLKSGALDHIPTDLVDRQAPLLVKHLERVQSHPRIAAYYAARKK